MRLKHIMIKNFGNTSNLSSDLWPVTYVEGANEVGKSTLRNAIFWALTNKMANGSAPDGIRPHDKDGKDVDFVDIEVELNMGDTTIKKVQSQKWSKPYGQLEKKFDGNVNSYLINDIPRKEKDFKALMEGIADADTMLYGMNAMALLGLDTKKRREKVLSLEEGFTDEEVVATNPEFATIPLNEGTPDELVMRSKRTIKALNEELNEIPPRIDELTAMKPDKSKIDEYEDSIKEEKTKLSAIEVAIEELTEVINKKDREADGIFDLKAKQNDLWSMANEANNNKRIKCLDRISNLRVAVSTAKAKMEDAGYRLKQAKKTFEALDAKYQAVKAEKFDSKSTICPTCHREYDAEHKAAIKEAFTADRKNRMNDIQMEGKKQKAIINDIVKEMKEIDANVKHFQSDLDKANEELKSIPGEVSVVGTEAWNALERQIKAKEKANDELDELISRRREAENDKMFSEHRLKTIEAELANYSADSRIDDRIAELKHRQKDIAEKVLKEEHMLDLIEAFVVAKINMLTERVNSHFNIIKWVMFKQNINGSWSPCCEPTVNGSSYFSTLNHGNKLLAEIDICCAFQMARGTKLPIIVDDMESVDSWRIPKVDTQLIICRRTDDKELVIREG